MAKDTDDRSQSMGDLVTQHDGPLVALADPDAYRTVMDLSPVSPPSRRPESRRRRKRRSRTPLVLLLIVLAAVGVAVGAYFGLRGSGSGGGGGGDGSVHLNASNAYDPEGDGREHDEEVLNA